MLKYKIIIIQKKLQYKFKFKKINCVKNCKDLFKNKKKNSNKRH